MGGYLSDMEVGTMCTRKKDVTSSCLLNVIGERR